MTQDLLDRLHRRLVDALRRDAPAPVDRPLTIADIYQHLVPYRSVRGELGISDLQEYEHTLLRLFSGERNYLRIDVDQVAEEFKRELRSPNPILGIYRDYAAVGLALNLGQAESRGATPDPRPAAAPLPADEVTLASPPPSPFRTPPALREAADAVGGSPDAEVDEPMSPRSLFDKEGRADVQEPPVSLTSCWHCHERLPGDREVRFCPHCGTVQVPTPCEECGSPVEPAWKFCVLCGSARDPLPVISSG